MAKLVDETGNVYGRLTVLNKDGLSKDHHAMWLCKCSCGKTVRVIGKDLRSGHTTSCGCYNLELITNQIIGQTFNKLTVIERAGTDKNRNSLWKCKCECDNIIITTAKSLKSNHKISCGCDTRSHGEQYVEKWLIKNNISFQSEYSFQELQDKSLLRFDFVLLKNNIPIGCIEVQGSQHYNMNDGYYKEEIIMHDQMKSKYCINNNIPLLLLDYSKGYCATDFTIWDRILFNFVEKLKEGNKDD